MAETIPYRFKLRGGTASEWVAANPILLSREPGVETDTRAFKIGDGTTPWNDLPYSGRNTTDLLAEAQSTAADLISAEDLTALRGRVTTLESSGTGGSSYDDTALRQDMANADAATLTSAQTHANNGDTALSNRLEPLEAAPTPVVLSRTQYDALATKDSQTLYFIRG